MLKQLHIKNFTIIDELNVDFHEGFSVITGETGAGKSIILGALSLLLGSRADIKTIKEGASKCIIEGLFTIKAYGIKAFFDENDIDYSDEDCILRREVNINGKSRAFINDTPVSLSLLKELGDRLIDIHSQHQNLLIQKDNFQLSVVDTIAHNQKLLSQYKDQYTVYLAVQHELARTKENIEKNKANTDFLRFQLEELQHLQLKAGEEEELDQLSNTMQHSEDIKSALYEADNHLGEETSGILTRLHKVASSLESILKVYPDAEDLTARINTSYIELKDASSDLAYMIDSIDYDPDKLEEINHRLDAIYTLEHKHHVSSVAELIELQNNFEETLNAVDNSEEALSDLQKKADAALQETEKFAKELTKERIKAVKLIEKDIAERLRSLGLPNVRFSIELAAKEISYDGKDKITFMFSANPGTPLYPISQIASGGEIARVMLSLKAMLSGATKLPTIIFDEIDTGVSGRVAEQMGKIMNEMGQADRQVISITHLPQIASAGNNHYKVFKVQRGESTTSHMKELNKEERINEIAQMLSGSNITSAAIDNAKELLGL